jgi:hypothetical protein
MIFNNNLLNIAVVVLLLKIVYDYKKQNENFNDLFKSRLTVEGFQVSSPSSLEVPLVVKNIKDMVSREVLNDINREYDKTKNESTLVQPTIKEYSVFAPLPLIRYTPIKNIGPFNVLTNEKYYLSIKSS